MLVVSLGVAQAETRDFNSLLSICFWRLVGLQNGITMGERTEVEEMKGQEKKILSSWTKEDKKGGCILLLPSD